jgi:Flp pilus assembly protein TadD
VAAERGELDEAISLLNRSLAVDPNAPHVLYQLSLAYGRKRDLANARATALRLARLAPAHPGLAEWLRLIGLRP